MEEGSLFLFSYFSISMVLRTYGVPVDLIWGIGAFYELQAQLG
jgi:hypothetical protein